MIQVAWRWLWFQEEGAFAVRASGADRLIRRLFPIDDVRLDMKRQGRHGIKIENVTPSLERFKKCVVAEASQPGVTMAQMRGGYRTGTPPSTRSMRIDELLPWRYDQASDAGNICSGSGPTYDRLKSRARAEASVVVIRRDDINDVVSLAHIRRKFFNIVDPGGSATVHGLAAWHAYGQDAHPSDMSQP